MSAHSDLLERHRQVMPSWLALYYDQPIELVDGKGCRARDAEGNEYLDFFGGILTTLSGYNVDEVVDAVREQAGRMMHTSTLYLIRPMIELAERIASLAPMPDAKVYLVNSGSEAVEHALLMATSARRSHQVLALRNSYHGGSFGAMAVTSNRGWSASSLSPFQVSHVLNGDRLRGLLRGRSEAEVIRECVEDLRTVIETTTSGDIACFIAEPIQGVGGFIVPPDGLFGAFKEVLDEYGILYVSDEVQTGWGRTGDHFWGVQAHGVEPDLVTFAKGLGNGLSIGGVVGRASLIDALGANHISTFGGNPLTCAGALANLEYLLRNDLQANARERGAQLLAGLRDLAPGVPVIAEVRGKGLMAAVEFAEPGTLAPLPAVAAQVLEETRRRGLLVGKGGLSGNVLRIAPPMSITSAEVAEGLGIVAAALEAI